MIGAPDDWRLKTAMTKSSLWCWFASTMVAFGATWVTQASLRGKLGRQGR